MYFPSNNETVHLNVHVTVHCVLYLDRKKQLTQHANLNRSLVVVEFA